MIKLLEHTRRPDITFWRDGRIYITARVARLLSLRPGDALNIAVRDGEYLMHAIHLHNAIGHHEAQCFPTNKRKGRGNNLRANSVRLCRILLNSSGITADRASYMIGEAFVQDSVTYVPIITLHPL